MPQYSAADIVGSTLFAAKDISLYLLPNDNSATIGTATSGNAIGVVAGYLEPDPAKNRKYLYWMFTDTYGNVSFWVRHTPDSFHFSDLTDQGIKDTLTKLDDEANAALTWYERLIKGYGLPLLIGLGVIYISASGVRGYFSRKK